MKKVLQYDLHDRAFTNERSPIHQPKSLSLLDKNLPYNCNQSTYRENLKDLGEKILKAAKHIAAYVIT